MKLIVYTPLAAEGSVAKMEGLLRRAPAILADSAAREVVSVAVIPSEARVQTSPNKACEASLGFPLPRE